MASTWLLLVAAVCDGEVMLEVVSLTSRHDVAFARWHEISTAVRRHDEVDPPILGLDQTRSELGREGITARRELFLAMNGGHAVGAGESLLRQLDNTHLVDFKIWVPPERRRQGVGSTLLDHICRRAGQQQRNTLVALVIGPPDGGLPGARFLEQRQFMLANTMIGRTLRLPVDHASLNELEAKAKARSGSYRLAGWVGPCPEQFAERYAYLRGIHLKGAPRGALDIREERWDVARLRDEEDQARRSGTRVYTTVALDESGDPVAHTQILVRAGNPCRASQGLTLVLREHRGHRLGLAVKVANLRAVQAAEPKVNRIGTANAEQNAPMIAVNEQLGFGIHDVGQEWQRTLA
jgi:GNAT superfamily N-acetyltransferase